MSLLALAAFLLLVGLGAWQVQRLKWKTGLLHRIDLLKTAPPAPIGAVIGRAPDSLDYIRVELDCPDLERTPALRLFTNHAGTLGYRLIAACALKDGPFGAVLVDRGFLPLDAAASPGRPLGAPVVGVLRLPERRTMVTSANRPSENLWYWRDIPGMAAQLKASRPAPVTLMLERPAPAGPWPQPAPLPVDIPNNHLQYALTWFGLAAALAGVYLAMLLRRRPS